MQNIRHIPSLTSRFLRKLPTSLCAPGNPALRNNIQLTLQNGRAEYCIKRKLDSTRPTVNNVLNFLHTLHAHDLSYSTSNMARSASSACLLDTTFSDTNYTITDHPLLIRYMKGVFNSWKPTPKYSETCDVSTLLNYLANCSRWITCP